MREKIILTYIDYKGNVCEEKVWGVNKDKDIYQVDNIPFYAPNLALNDIISIERDKDYLYFSNLLETSGNSTLQLIFFNKSYNDILNKLEDLGCQWEGMKNQYYFAINIPKNVDYLHIRKYLDGQLTEKVLDFKEACLSEKHKEEVSRSEKGNGTN